MPRARSLARGSARAQKQKLPSMGNFHSLRGVQSDWDGVPFLGLRKRQCRPSAYRDEQVRLEFSVAIGGAAEMGEGAA